MHCFVNSAKSKSDAVCVRSVSKLGHTVWTLGSLHFCGRCGAYSGGRIGLLADLGGGKPWSEHLKRSRARLLGGLHPVSSRHLGDPFPFLPCFGAGSEVEDPLSALLVELG